MTDYNCSAILKDLCAYSIYFLVKSCVYKRGYLFLILLLTNLIIKYRGLDKAVALTNDQKEFKTWKPHPLLRQWGSILCSKSVSQAILCTVFGYIILMFAVYSLCKDKEPWSVGIHFPSVKVQNHCPACHNDLNGEIEQCPCLETTRWYQSSTWTCVLKIDVWKHYFQITRRTFYAPLKTSSLYVVDII